MRNIFLFLMVAFVASCKAQTYPLRTYSEIPESAYLMDTNNELISYVGTWSGGWDGKVIYITFKKITNRYNSVLKHYEDVLIGKFKVVDGNGIILFDNTNVLDEKAKIEGGKFRKKDGKYSLSYLDMDLCGRNGYITILFTDSTKTKLEWELSEGEIMIDSACFYHNQQWPEPLPPNIILTKQ